MAPHSAPSAPHPQDKKRRGQPKIWLYKDKATGEFKGEATVTYEDAFAASSAPSWFNDKEWKGELILLLIACSE